MKTRALVLAVICNVYCAFSLLAAERAIENQFRVDYEVIVRRAWKVSEAERSDEVRREVDQMVDGMRTHLPLLLQDGKKPPSDTDLQKRWEKLLVLEGSFTGRGFPLWEHYIPLWKGRKMNQEQKVIFSRLIDMLIEEHEARNQRRDGGNG